MDPLLAEFVGTALLLLLGNGVVANVSLRETFGHDSGWIVITAGWGLAVFAAVTVAGPSSGAHLNPAVTVGLAAAGEFAWGQVGGYLGAQMAGGFVGATLCWLAYHEHYAVTENARAKLSTFCNTPAIDRPAWNMVTEILGTFSLVFVVLHFTGAELDMDGTVMPVGLGSVGAIPVGLLVFGIGLSLGGPTGYAINPARDLAPRVAHTLLPVAGKGSSFWSYAWIPVVGPLLGGLLAAWVQLAVLS